jgi:hypothetical protein
MRTAAAFRSAMKNSTNINKETVMKVRGMRWVMRRLGVAFLSCSLAFAPFVARAGIVTTDALTAQQETDANRAKIESFLQRADAAGKLQEHGVSAQDAKNRVAALSDGEARELAAQIDSLPAGGNFGSFTDDQLIIILLVVILVAIIASS